MCPGPLFVYTTMYHHQEKEEVLQYYLILPRKVLFDSFVKKKLRIDYEHFLFSCFEIKNTSLLCKNFDLFRYYYFIEESNFAAWAKKLLDFPCMVITPID